MKYLTTILLIFFLGCQNKSQQTNSTENNRDTMEPQTSFQEITIPENEPEPTIIDSIYLTNTGWGESYGWVPLTYEPKDKSREGSSINLGGKLYIVEDKGDWLKVWSKLRQDRNGKYYSQTDTVYGSLYIKKELTGKFEELLLSKEELSIVSDWSKEERYISEDTLSFRFITKEEYFTEKATAVSHISTNDILNIKNMDGKLVLPCRDKTVTFTDRDDDTDYCKYYTYMGEIPLLNVYLIRGRYFESGDYFFIDKDTGEETISFGDFPILSPDGKYIVNMGGNPYESYTEFNLSQVTENSTSETLLSHIFTKWMPFTSPYDEEISYFWGNNYQLYVKIQTARLASQIDEDYAIKYIKIKIGIINPE